MESLEEDKRAMKWSILKLITNTIQSTYTVTLCTDIFDIYKQLQNTFYAWLQCKYVLDKKPHPRINYIVFGQKMQTYVWYVRSDKIERRIVIVGTVLMYVAWKKINKIKNERIRYPHFNILMLCRTVLRLRFCRGIKLKHGNNI